MDNPMIMPGGGFLRRLLDEGFDLWQQDE